MHRSAQRASQSVKADRRLIPLAVPRAFDVIQNFAAVSGSLGSACMIAQATSVWLTIRARSADYRGNLNSRRDISYNDTTLEAVVSAVAARNNLKPAIAEPFRGTVVAIKAGSLGDSGFVTTLNLEVLLSDVSYEAGEDDGC